MKRTILAVLAHPDDESYGIGGTLARYAADDVEVHVAIATDGAAGSIDEKWQGDSSKLADARAMELHEAAEVLGVNMHMLGYRDSGYIGDPANANPDAFINVDEHETTGCVVKLIRELRPDIVITHDETGGYFHPDHIQCYKITTAAFFAARKPELYPEHRFDPYQPKRLYYSAFSNRLLKIGSLLMRLRGQDPSRGGRNQDIDYTRLGTPPERITTTISCRKSWDLKMEASARHGSQGGGTSISRLMPMWLFKAFFAKEAYIRAYPPVPAGYREKDFFSGLDVE